MHQPDEDILRELVGAHPIPRRIECEPEYRAKVLSVQHRECLAISLAEPRHQVAIASAARPFHALFAGIAPRGPKSSRNICTATTGLPIVTTWPGATYQYHGRTPSDAPPPDLPLPGQDPAF